MIYFLKPLCAVLPAAILMWFLCGRGKGLSISFEKVKWAYIWGIIAFIVVILSPPSSPEVKNIFNILCCSAFPEELTKMAIMLVLLRRFRCSNLIDVLVICGSVGLGFACLENLIYVLPESNWIIVSIVRAISSVPSHFSYAIIMGYFVYRAFNIVQTKKQKFFNLSIAFILPTLIHWNNNALPYLLESNLILLILYIIPIVLLIIVLKILKKARKEAISKQQIISNDTVMTITKIIGVLIIISALLDWV